MNNYETETMIADFDASDVVVLAAADKLAAGELVALPTETVYGLAADATNSEAVAKVFEVKERPSFDPLIVHIESAAKLSQVASVPEDIKGTVDKLVHKFWPGPLTIVLPKQADISDLVTSGLETVAVRCPQSPVMKKILKKIGRPLAAPSANRFGRISPTSASAVQKELNGRIPLIIDGGACLNGLESTIISIEAPPEEGKKAIINILRYGPVLREDLREFGKVNKVKPVLDEKSPEAPGQLASHYAPVTPLRLIEDFADFKPDPNKSYGLLSYSGDAKGFKSKYDWKACEMLSPGSGKLAEAAVRLFFAMRKLDESGVDEIIAEPCSDKGLGLAIMDKLRRASVS